MAKRRDKDVMERRQRWRWVAQDHPDGACRLFRSGSLLEPQTPLLLLVDCAGDVDFDANVGCQVLPFATKTTLSIYHYRYRHPRHVI